MRPTVENGLILVTGAAGFIGSHVVNSLGAKGYRVVGCDDLGQGEQWRYIASSPLHDWITPDDARHWLSSHLDQVAAIIHLGAISSTTTRDVDALVRQNIRFTLDLWELACAHHLVFLYASSAASYGDGAFGFVDRDDEDYLSQLRPLNAYGWSKHVVDRRIMADYRRGKPLPLRWAGMKFFNVYGPHEQHKGDMQSLVSKFVPRIRAGEPISLFQSHRPDYADGGQLRDFVYVRDVVAWIEHALHQPELQGLFNIGSGQARSFYDLVKSIYNALGIDENIVYIPIPESIRSQYQYYTQADIAKAAALGFPPPLYALEAGVADCVRHLIEGSAG